MESTGKDPFICPHCGQEMDICTIWHPRYGVIYDELEEIRRGKYEQKEKEAFGEEGNGRAIRVLLRRSTITVVQYVELSFLVNEAIIDAGIGMAKFNKEYYEGYMPKVGCPGCNNYTMECVE